MDIIPRVLIVAGVLLVLAGLAFWAAQSIGLGRLPGDIVVERPHMRIAFPIVTSLVISLVLTVVLNVALRIWR